MCVGGRRGRPPPGALARLVAHQTRDLLAFVEHWLPGPPARVLEVGCGDGSLTRHLISAGFAATGIDPEAPDGDHLVRSTLEEFQAPEPFDAAVAVRSLHHVADLERAVAQLHSLLRPGGRLIMFEFAVEHVDDAASAWLASHGLGDALDYDFSGVIALGELEEALGRRFSPLLVQPAPYLARELGHDELHEAEAAAIADGKLRAAGEWLVFEPRRKPTTPG
jgi:SAM-dependent methyltransferase